MPPTPTYAHTYATLFGAPPPTATSWSTSQAALLSPGRGFMAAFDYTLQLQVGCPGGCLFCYVPTSPFLTPPQMRGAHGESWGFQVRNKARVAEKLAAALESGQLADQTIYWSGVTDPYAAPPGTTRQLWERLAAAPPHQRPRRLVVQSRFRPDRDLQPMGRYAAETRPADGGPAVVVSYSIGTDQDELIRAWERATPLFGQRMAAVQRLRQAGICVVVTLSPLGYWSDLHGTLSRLQAWGVAYLTTLFFKQQTPSANTPAHFLTYLRQYHPMLLDADWQHAQLRTMQAVFGPDRVLTGKAGFESLATPQRVGPGAGPAPTVG